MIPWGTEKSNESRGQACSTRWATRVGTNYCSHKTSKPDTSKTEKRNQSHGSDGAEVVGAWCAFAMLLTMAVCQGEPFLVERCHWWATLQRKRWPLTMAAWQGKPFLAANSIKTTLSYCMAGAAGNRDHAGKHICVLPGATSGHSDPRDPMLCLQDSQDSPPEDCTQNPIIQIRVCACMCAESLTLPKMCGMNMLNRFRQAGSNTRNVSISSHLLRSRLDNKALWYTDSRGEARRNTMPCPSMYWASKSATMPHSPRTCCTEMDERAGSKTTVESLTHSARAATIPQRPANKHTWIPPAG